ncbi:MAG: sulfotransferase, partial [Planctomycetes bacterium]|nr:sulfotransferase [Planctomycetota bacterium]
MRERLVKSFHFVVRNAARVARVMHPLYTPLAATPLFIVGAARSGNTLLRRMLMAASPIHIPPEMGFMFEAIECYRERRYYRWPALVRRTMKWFAHNEQFADMLPRLIAVEAALIALPRERRSLSSIVDAVYRDDAARLGRAVTHWGDKTPRNARHMDKIASAFEAVKFVHLIRDGADVVHSIMAKDGLRDFRGPARRWIEPVTAARAYTRAH